jgi:hypothetical protein
MYASNPNYKTRFHEFNHVYQSKFDDCFGWITVETEYTFGG